MLKNTKLTAIAMGVVAACCLPLAAQAQSSIQIYGKIYPEIVRTELSGATAKGTAVSTLAAAPASAGDVSATSEDSPNSRLGFRGTEKLGDNLKVFFQLEMGFGVDTGANTSTTSLFSRDTFIGVEGGFGTVKLGSMDTVYKNVGDTLSFLGISSGNFISISSILSKGGFGSSSASSFHLRRPNSMIYESPSFGGFQWLFDYSLGEVANDSSRENVISTAFKYEAGPFYAALAYERHNDLFGGSKNVPTALRNDANPLAHSRDNAMRLTGQYKVSETFRAEANIARLEYDESGGATGKFQNYKHNSWSVSGEYKFTPAATLAVSFGAATAGSCSLVGNVVCNTGGLDGKMINLGVGYNLSKRTMLFALYSYLGNGESAVYNNYANGKPATGQDIKTAAFGLSHTF